MFGDVLPLKVKLQVSTQPITAIERVIVLFRTLRSYGGQDYYSSPFICNYLCTRLIGKFLSSPPYLFRALCPGHIALLPLGHLDGNPARMRAFTLSC